MSLPYIFLCFPRDKRLTVYQQIEANEHARYMYQFMEQRREQFKMQQHGAQMPMYHDHQRPNRFNCRRRQRKNKQSKNVNCQPIRQAPVNPAEPIISQQPKYNNYHPSRQAHVQVKLSFVQHQPIRQAPVHPAKPIISQCQPMHHQPKYDNYQPSRQAAVKVMPSSVQRQPIRQTRVHPAKPIISQCQHQQPKYNNYQPTRQAPGQTNPCSAKPQPKKPNTNTTSQYQAKHLPKKSTKVCSDSENVDSGVGSSANSGNRSPIKFLPNAFYNDPFPVSGHTISPTGVKLVPNPFYTGPPTTLAISHLDAESRHNVPKIS
uniref:Uncharacterized protein n=1 Tax=Caenorhabditis japonica TaxID=281687 RepID=A0A8R1DGU6_CAEJA